MESEQTKHVVDWKSIWYGLVVFVSSACLLVLEITAGRLLAPYIGVSLYTWTSIIGVILAGMALGNWVGGKLADLHLGEWVVGVVLAASGIASIGVLMMLMLVAPWVQALATTLLGASFAYVLFLFFLPALLIGVVTPLVITMNLTMTHRPGKVVGRLHALAALGSIVGTFLTGYWLIQWFGTRAIIMATGATLLMLGLPFLYRRWTAISIVLIAALTITSAGAALNGFANPCDVESRYYCVRVVNDEVESTGVSKVSLVLDHMTHSTNHASEPRYLLTPYVHSMDELIHQFFLGQRLDRSAFLFAGGGAYTHPRAVQSLYPDADITVVELDPKVTEVATQRMFANTETMNIIHGDTRRIVESLPLNYYSVAVIDVFHDLAIPYHLASREFFESLKQRMKSRGLFLINVVDIFPDPLLAKSIYKTLQRSFLYIDVWMETPPDKQSRLTYVISASDINKLPDVIIAHAGVDRTWYRVTDAILSTGTSLQYLPEITNDYAPVERLLSPLYLTPSGL